MGLRYQKHYLSLTVIQVDKFHPPCLQSREFKNYLLPGSRIIFAWFKNYLSDRKQRVVLPSTVSDWTLLRAGVPQGSILGPLLFLLNINDIVTDIGSHIRLFADDTSLFIIVDKPITAVNCLNTDLNKISRWAETWLVTFNPTKTEALLFLVN